MAKEMQNSIRYSTVLTIFEIPDHVEIGKLIGRKGRNLKPIEKGTGTHIYIYKEISPRQIEIKINNDNKDRGENISTGERINKAICQIDKLLEDIKIRNQRKDNEKEEENVKIADSDTNHQDATVTTITTVATPKNHKDNDLKEKIKRFKQKNIPYDQNTTNKIFQECMDLLIFYLIICLSNIRFYIFSKEDAKRNSPINRMN
ncbi:uncharacterized protein OCT59_015637 [Rhizophagus irregularis]|uniref:K Homology domain-containing protein n=3 Tax=Rhizophagus irregularis TaxID=588596 RepID=A0A015KP90_RHIIW|nr:hypothetical protein RirG_096430 [Rhizophagus irregularis DAOM 197198w]UZO23294.1 hypothetical protein OCT59_015637 [Rhizophagus irregularis]GBC15424.2 hypothetical protein GLOIN_2v1835204 [Rhizophagus irregularis DAOM 181602=DAOM 197198]